MDGEKNTTKIGVEPDTFRRTDAQYERPTVSAKPFNQQGISSMQTSISTHVIDEMRGGAFGTYVHPVITCGSIRHNAEYMQ